MTISKKVVNYTFYCLTSLICRINTNPLTSIPAKGPLIIVANHVNFLEIPILITRMGSRSVTGFAKIETWDNPILGYLFNLWEIIPIQRGEADVGALREALRALTEGKILAIAPEGTRSGHGRLQQGHPGVVLLALRSGASLLPLVYYGGEKIWQNLSRLRRTNFDIVVGKPFYLRAEGVKVTQAVRQQMTDEIMWQLAALLPPVYRGHYANLSDATEDFLRFPPASKSNLPLASREDLNRSL
jgi:1-acyl-sn-glycerol-3-phosphate acyltransferase